MNYSYMIAIAGVLVGLAGWLRNYTLDAEKTGRMEQDISTIKDGIDKITKQIDKLNDNFNVMNQRISKLEVRVDNLEKCGMRTETR